MGHDRGWAMSGCVESRDKPRQSPSGESGMETESQARPWPRAGSPMLAAGSVAPVTQTCPQHTACGGSMEGPEMAGAASAVSRGSELPFPKTMSLKVAFSKGVFPSL